jgi:hypothetical protein
MAESQPWSLLSLEMMILLSRKQKLFSFELVAWLQVLI